MAELSSNWKKLQAKIKAESSSQSSTKRKIPASVPPAKRSKTGPALLKRHRVVSRPQTATGTRMGNVHSTKVEDEPKQGPSPSLALWAEDNGVSAEALAEAYELGTKNNSLMLRDSFVSFKNFGNIDLFVLYRFTC